MGGAQQPLTGPDFKQGIPADSIKSGQKILGHVDGTPVILAMENNRLFAIGALCSHYSANLNDGIIVDGTIRCPWHHACFDLKTGEAKKAPALNPIPVWEVEVKNSTLYVTKKKELETPKTPLGKSEHFVIVGSGAAGHAAAERLRREGFGGTLTVISEDQDLPYDRPNLSKDYLAGTAPEEWMSLRSDEFYRSHQIRLMLNSKVASLDTKQKTLRLANGEEIKFDKCLLATGGSPIKPQIEGIESPNVHFLRSFADCRSIIGVLQKSKRVAIVGAGFIGLESAAALRTRGIEISVIAPNPLPLSHVVGNEIGQLLKSVHEQHGVRFYLNSSIEKIENDCVVLNNGTRIGADLILVATGIAPNISLAANAGIECGNGIPVNEYLQTSEKDIFAAGDITLWQSPYTGKPIRVEHWVVAQRQGQLAAQNMLGMQIKNNDVPFFWSQQFDLTINYVGHVKPWTKTQIFGNVSARECAVAYYDGSKIAAVLTIGRDRLSLLIEEAMKNNDFRQIENLLTG